MESPKNRLMFIASLIGFTYLITGALNYLFGIWINSGFVLIFLGLFIFIEGIREMYKNKNVVDRKDNTKRH